MSLINTKSPQDDKYVNFGSLSGCPFYLTWSHLKKKCIDRKYRIYIKYIDAFFFQDFESLYRWKYIGNDKSGIEELKEVRPLIKGGKTHLSTQQT